MADEQQPDMTIHTGGGQAVIGDIGAGGDIDLSRTVIYGDKVYGDKYVYKASPPPPPYDPPPLPPLNENGHSPLLEPASLPPRSRVAFPANPLFTGREDELRALAKALLYEPAGQMVIISTGIGGVGKTQLAAEFAHRYGLFYAGGVQWLSAESPDNVPSEVVACGAAMGLWADADEPKLSQEAKVSKTVQAWQSATPRLLVFDNCENAGLLQEWRPKSGGARVLVTSRSADWPAGGGLIIQPLDTLPREQSIALLREYLAQANPPRSEADEDLNAVAAELGDLPLALVLAGSYLARYSAVSLTGYLTALRSPALLEHPSLKGKGRPYRWTEHEMDVGRTFAISYDRLNPADAVDAAALRLLAGATCFLHGEPLTPELLMFILITDPAGPPGPELPEDALNRLLELGLLELAGPGWVRLHRLLARFAAGALARALDIAQTDVEWAVQVGLDIIHQSGDPRWLRGFESQLRHVVDQALTRDDESAARLANNLGHTLQSMGDLARARPYLERALAITERVLGPDHPQTATSLSNLGYLLQLQGNLARARLYLERALEVYKRVLGPDHPLTATGLNNLGRLIQTQGDLTGARPYLERALEINERVLGPDHPDTAQSLNNLGLLLKTLGDLAGARPYYERALAVRERVLGPDHPDTAQSLNNLGSLLYAEGDLVGARPYYERALVIDEKILGPDHPDTAIDYNNLGGLMRALGDLTGARPYFERALAVRERVLGPDHPDTAQSLNNLGSLLYAQGDLARARLYFERALAVWECVLGPDHPDIAGGLNNLGSLLLDLGDLAGARAYLERALVLLEKALGANHLNVATLHANLSVLAHQSGDLRATREHLWAAYRIYQKVLLPNHSQTRATRDHLGNLLLEMRDWEGLRQLTEGAPEGS